MQKNSVRLILLLTICCAMNSCGTKGPLYIPEQRYPQGVDSNSIPKYAVLDALQANIHKPCRPALECFIAVAA